jgi:hypothetical protein
MKRLFEILKGFFFFFSLIIWLFFLRWNYLFVDKNFTLIWKILLPGYLIFVWLMIWYIISDIRTKKLTWETASFEEISSAYTKSLLIWLWIWVFLAIIYSIL